MSRDATEVVRRYLDAVGSLDLDALAETFAADVVMDLALLEALGGSVTVPGQEVPA